MGVMRFLVRPVDVLEDWPEKHRAYVSGMDQTVWPTRIEMDGEYLIVRRQASESGKVNIPWPVPGFGQPIVTTSSLPERERPYLLPVELARGKIVQVRNQVAQWQQMGMTVPAEFVPLNRQSHHYFAKAASTQDRPDEAAGFAQQALSSAFKAAEVLTRSYSRQRLDTRHKQYPRLPTALGCGLGSRMPDEAEQGALERAFNSVTVPVEWRVIEPVEGEYHWDDYDRQLQWATERGLLVSGGPLLDLSPDGLPNWLWQWEHDYWNLESFVCDFVETAISRYLGRIRVWEVVARGNTGGMLALSEEQRLQLVAKTLDTARRADPEAKFLIRIDQPWGEYQARGQHRLSAMQFADALIRAGIPVSVLHLELAIGYAPRGSLPRDLLDGSRLIDQWSQLGVPLQVTLAAPSETGPDALLETDLEVERGGRKTVWSPELQGDWIEAWLPMLLAKPAVTAVFWAHLSDRVPHRFPNGGLLDSQGKVKPGYERVRTLFQEYWRKG